MMNEYEEKTDQELKDFPKDRAARCFRKKHAIVIVLVVVAIFLAIAPTGQYLNDTLTAFRANGVSWQTVREIGWNTRWFIGRFRSAPSDEKMITYLNDHRAEFDRLAKTYYEDVAKTGSYSKTNERLKAQLRSLGLWKLNPKSGPYILNFGKDAPVFCAFGVYFKLADHGPHSWWGFGQKLEKTYLYMPTIPHHPKWSNDPREWLRGYDYVVPNSDSPSKEIEEKHCAVRQIDHNWFIQNCDAEAYNH